MKRQASTFILSIVLTAFVCRGADTNGITSATVEAAEKLNSLDFTPAQREQMLPGLKELTNKYAVFRSNALPVGAFPAVLFDPVPAGMKLETIRKKTKWSRVAKSDVPANLDDMAFASVEEWAALLKARKVTSTQLTRMYLARLKKFGPQLHCVVNLTEDRALAAAAVADKEIAAGHYKGMLHGIPYGVKDLLAARGAPTTWGAFKDQVIDEDAAVVQKLDAAGAVLVAKLSMGELAMGDVWFGGRTRNPWDTAKGSGGSSAGPASATAAGLVAFSIGSETYGSIIEPCTTCGVTGLRPTYGRVSRTGAMSLSWSMDKLGPICRTVEDCAVVLDAICGPDEVDRTVRDVPFNYEPKVDLAKLQIGYLEEDFDREKNGNSLAALAKLRELGAHLVPVHLPKYAKQMTMIIRTEGAAEFDEMTRSHRDNALAQQSSGSWPDTFRQAQMIPAVEYLQAQRWRTVLIEDMAQVMENIDVYVAPSESDDNVRLTNLTGHPAVVVPDGFDGKGHPTSISFVGKLFGEANLLAVTKAYQDATGFQLKHPKLAEDARP